MREIKAFITEHLLYEPNKAEDYIESFCRDGVITSEQCDELLSWYRKVTE